MWSGTEKNDIIDEGGGRWLIYEGNDEKDDVN